MRQLTSAEQILLERRTKEFHVFFSEMMPVLADFVEQLGFSQPAMVIAEPEMFVDGVANFFINQNISNDDRIWASTRLGYFNGEMLNKRRGGCWYVNTDPDSQNFLRYVVGKFQSCFNQRLSVDPISASDQFLSEPAGRDLRKLIDDIETEMQNLTLYQSD